jgi:hypothetical protein
VHRASAQTRFSSLTGFDAKNHSTILSFTAPLSRFSDAHLHQQTNISSPFISVYDTLAQAEEVAHRFARMYREDTHVMTIDTNHLARGPVFRAADLLKQDSGDEGMEWLHEGEYLFMYRIPIQAVRGQRLVAKGVGGKQSAVGITGRPK